MKIQNKARIGEMSEKSVEEVSKSQHFFSPTMRNWRLRHLAWVIRLTGWFPPLYRAPPCKKWDCQPCAGELLQCRTADSWPFKVDPSFYLRMLSFDLLQAAIPVMTPGELVRRGLLSQWVETGIMLEWNRPSHPHQRDNWKVLGRDAEDSQLDYRQYRKKRKKKTRQ